MHIFFFFSEEVVRFFFFQKFSLQSCCKTVHLKSLEIEPIKAKDFSGSMKNQSFMNLQIYISSQKGIIIIVFFFVKLLILLLFHCLHGLVLASATLFYQQSLAEEYGH